MDVVATPSLDETKQPERPKLRDIMGPGLITGASDDDPNDHTGLSFKKKPARQRAGPR